MRRCGSWLKRRVFLHAVVASFLLGLMLALLGGETDAGVPPFRAVGLAPRLPRT